MPRHPRKYISLCVRVCMCLEGRERGLWASVAGSSATNQHWANGIEEAIVTVADSREQAAPLRPGLLSSAVPAAGIFAKRERSQAGVQCCWQAQGIIIHCCLRTALELSTGCKTIHCKFYNRFYINRCLPFLSLCST